jgi:hypothetical protein
MENKFAREFDKFVCVGDSISVDVGVARVVAHLEHDQDTLPSDFDCYEPADVARWKNGDWIYVGVVLSVWVDDVCLDKHAASLWGIEANFGGDNSYLTEVANELLDEANPESIVEAFREKLAVAG